MPLSFTASNASPASVAVDLLVVPIARGEKGGRAVFGPTAEMVDAALGGGLATFLQETGFDGALGTTLAVPTAGKLKAKAAILVGIGEAADVTVDGLRRAAAAVAKRSTKAASVATTLAQAGDTAGLDAGDAAQAVTEGFALGGYQYLDYKGDAKPSKLRKVTLLGATSSGVKDGIARGSVVGEAAVWARDLVNTPAKEKSPAAMAAAAQRYLRGSGVRVQVLDLAQIRAQRLGGVLGVGQGSQQTPRFLKMTYTPSRARPALRSRWWARAWCSTPVACRSRRAAAWRR